MKHLLACIFFFCLPGFCFSQTRKTIEEMAGKHQDCLDEGKHMLQCAHDYYIQMDSMLNLVYSRLRKNLNEQEKAALKTEQLAWLKKRDRYFTEQKKEYQQNIDSEAWGTDMFMVVYDNDAEFVKERVLVLTDRLNILVTRPRL